MVKYAICNIWPAFNHVTSRVEGNPRTVSDRLQ